MDLKNLKEQLGLASRILVAAMGGLIATLVVLIIFYRAGGLPTVAPPIVLTGDALQLANGQGVHTATGLEVRQADTHGLVAIQGSAGMVRAAIYNQILWQIKGLESGRPLRLLWTTLAEPRAVRELVLPPAGPEGGLLDLRSEPRWQGRIAVIGLASQGPLREPLSIQRLELRPPVFGIAELARVAFDEWTVFEDWSQRSINYTAGAPLDALFPPVLIVALWVGCSAALYAVCLSPPVPQGWWPYATLFLLGWLVLDGRWQWDLNRRLYQTEARFAGKQGDERLAAGLDGALYQFLLDVRQRLPQEPARVFIVSADPGGFAAGRARYHLLPHNGFMGFAQPPNQAQTRPGDYVLILSPLTGVRYNSESQQIEWAKQRLAADLLHVAAPGALFQIRENVQ